MVARAEWGSGDVGQADARHPASGGAWNVRERRGTEVSSGPGRVSCGWVSWGRDGEVLGRNRILSVRIVFVRLDLADSRRGRPGAGVEAGTPGAIYNPVYVRIVCGAV